MTTDFSDYVRGVVVDVSVDNPPVFWAGKTYGDEQTDLAWTGTKKKLDVNEELARNGHDGYLVNDGAQSLEVEISGDGEDYGDVHTVKQDETLDLFMLDVDTIRLTWSGNTSYRVLVV